MSEPTAAPPTLLARLGPRTRRRAEPRASIALAGAGCLLVVVGAMVLSVEGASTGDGDFNRWPGLLLTAGVAASGIVVQHLFPRTPLATAGTVAVVLSVPACLGFATFDSGSFTPISAEPVLVVSTLTYAVLYVAGPGRGRPAYLGAAAIGAWATVLQLAEHTFDWSGSVFGVFLFPFFPLTFGWQSVYMFDDEGDALGGIGGFDSFDPTTAGLLSLLIGVGFVLLSRRLDRRGFAGAATPLLVAAVPALQAGVFLLAPDLDPAGAGLLVTAIGAGLLLHGPDVGRRATTWVGGLLVAAGIVPIVLDITQDAGAVGVLLLLAGAGLVAAAQLWAQQRGEPDELTVTRGRPRRTEPLRAE